MGLNDANMSTQASVLIDRPQQEVWSYLQDLTHLENFMPQLKWVKLKDGQMGTVGAIYEQYTKAGMAGVKSKFEVIGVEPGYSITWKQNAGNSNSMVRVQQPVTTYRLTQEGDATRVDLESNFSMQGNSALGDNVNPWMIFQKLMLSLFGKTAEKRSVGYLDDLKSWIESQPPQQMGDTGS